MTSLRAASIDHINLQVKDLAKTVAFYRDLFGFELKQDQSKMNSKIIGNDSIKLALYEDPDLVIGDGFNHFGMHIENFDDIVARCTEMNVSMPYGITDWGKSRSVYIVDPNGYEIELSEVQGGGL